MHNFRSPIPQLEWGKTLTDALYRRYSTLKSKANKQSLPFPWPKFLDYAEAVKKVAPEDYRPDRYRIRFDLAQGGGYSTDNMIFTKVIARGSEKKALQEEPVKEQNNTEWKIRLATELTALIMTEEGDLSALAAKAVSIINATGEDNHG